MDVDTNCTPLRIIWETQWMGGITRRTHVSMEAPKLTRFSVFKFKVGACAKIVSLFCDYDFFQPVNYFLYVYYWLLLTIIEFH